MPILRILNGPSWHYKYNKKTLEKIKSNNAVNTELVTNIITKIIGIRHSTYLI